MDRRRFLHLSSAAAGLAMLPRGFGRSLERAHAAGGPIATRPNILLIVSDDWGWPLYGFMRPEIGPCLSALLPSCDLGTDPFCQPNVLPVPRTPNLDALAAGGIAFSFGITTRSESGPARQSIQTGLNRRDLDKGTVFVHREDADKAAKVAAGGRVTIPIALEALGYKTYGMGKWYVDGTNLSSNFSVNPPGSGVESQANVTVNGAQIFRDFLDGPAQGPEPWHVMFCPFVPHQPYYSAVPYNYTGWKDQSATTCGDKIITLGKDAVPRLMQSCTWMDTLVGDVVQALEDRGLRENTVIIYTTDNGAALTRGKASFYEDGMRTPILLNSTAPPGSPWHIPARGLHHAMVGVIDILPTILDYAREGQSSIPSWVPDPSDKTRFPDALSLRPVADGTTDDLRTLLFSNRDPGSDKSVREAVYAPGTDTLVSLYKLYVSKAGAAKQLFDLLANPFENPKQNLVKDPAQAARVAALKAAIAAW